MPRTSADALPDWVKKREKIGWIKEVKRIWAPLVIGRAIQRIRMNLKT